MEILFLTTHAIMLICAICIVYLSISNVTGNNEIAKPTIISPLVGKVRSLQITTADLYRIATALLAIFLRS